MPEILTLYHGTTNETARKIFHGETILVGRIHKLFPEDSPILTDNISEASYWGILRTHGTSVTKEQLRITAGSIIIVKAPKDLVECTGTIAGNPSAYGYFPKIRIDAHQVPKEYIEKFKDNPDKPYYEYYQVPQEWIVSLQPVQPRGI